MTTRKGWLLLLLVFAAPALAQRWEYAETRERKAEPMALTRWTNATRDFAWGTAGNWNTGSVPVNDDDVVFDWTCTDSVKSGSAQAAVDLDSLVIYEGYTGDLFTENDPLHIYADYVYHGGNGKIHLDPTSGAGKYIDLLVINSDGGGAVLNGAVTHSYFIDGDVSLVPAFGRQVGSSYLTVGGTAYVDMAVTGAISSVTQYGGEMRSDAGCTTLYMYGGTHIRTSATGRSTTIVYQLGGYYYHNYGNITTLYLLGGIFDGTGDPVAKTITTAYIMPTATYLPGGAYTITNGGDVIPTGDTATTRVWTSATAGSWDDAGNWSGDATVVSLVNATYEWIASGDSYYVRLVAGAADPELSDPDSVEEDDVDMTEGTLGSLTAGQWAYGDDDALGYSTVYVRLSDSADPDGKAEDFVEWERIRPDNGDTAVFDGTAVGSVTSGLDQATFNLAMLYTYPGYSGDIGTSDDSLEISADVVYYAGAGTLYYDHSGAGQTDLMAVDSDNQDDAAVLSGDIRILAAIKGKITLAVGFGVESTICRVFVGHRSNPRGDVWIVDNSTTNASNRVFQSAGTYDVNGVNPDYVRMTGGYFNASASATSTVLIYRQAGGSIVHNAGGITWLQQTGGTFDMSQNATPKTITDAEICPGATFIPNASTTITNGGPTGTGSILP